MKSNKFLLITFLAILMMGISVSSFFQIKLAKGQSVDAIAIRILPNPDHYGIERWYKEKGFSGSPQFLLVDGYEAVRDGRTVYVNATNIDTAAGKIYTNVYLISYNQDSKEGTTDILGQIISHWRFNSNIGSGLGNCGNASSAASSTVCLIDTECPSGFYCNSLKAAVTRDIKRLGVLADYRTSLAEYHAKNGRFPDLVSGTYIPHVSVSTWPSWQNTLAPALGVEAQVDPINKLGSCPGYDSNTCWNKDLGKFADSIPADPSLNLPTSSQAMVYQVTPNGSSYNLCAVMESRSTNNLDTNDQQLSNSACVLTSSGAPINGGNRSPQLVAINLQGEAGKEFSGYIKVSDPDGDPLSWALDTSGATWYMWANNSAPVLVDTGNPGQKKVYSSKAGPAINYSVKITVQDGRGGVYATTTNIKIASSKPTVEAINAEYLLNAAIPLDYSFYVYDEAIDTLDGTQNGAKGKLTPNPSPNGNTFWYYTSGAPVAINDGLFYSTEKVAKGKFKVRIYGTVTQAVFPNDKELKYRYVACNNNGFCTSKDFSILLKVDTPEFNFQCEENTRQYEPYECNIQLFNAANHNITYSFSGLNPALHLSAATTTDGKAKIYGQIFGPRPVVTANGFSHFLGDSFRDVLATSTEFVNFETIVGGECTDGHGNNNEKDNGQDAYNSDDEIDTQYNDGNIDKKDNPTDDSEINAVNEKNKSKGSLNILKKINPLAWLGLSWAVDVAQAAISSNTNSGDSYIDDNPVEIASNLTDQNLANNLNATQASSTIITVNASNEYSATTSKSFTIRINSYCGDGIKQFPNSEGRGGAYNDGNEECDGVDGIATSTGSSSVNRQYACTTATSTITPNPILSNNYCRFTGGYCGDGICGSLDNTFSTDNYEVYDPINRQPNDPQSALFCHKDCAYCGDGAVQYNLGEECDPGDPYSYNADLGESCNNRCKSVRSLKILQVYAQAYQYDNTTGGNVFGKYGGASLEVKDIINSLLSNPESSFEFKNSVTIATSSSGNIVDTISLDCFNNGTSNHNLPYSEQVGSGHGTYLAGSYNINGSISNSGSPAYGCSLGNVLNLLPDYNTLAKYNLIVFGFKDANGALNSEGDLSSAARARLGTFIKNGGMVIFGHDTIMHDYSNGSGRPNFNSFATSAGISDVENTSCNSSSSPQPITQVVNGPNESPTSTILIWPFRLHSAFPVRPTAVSYNVAMDINSSAYKCGVQCGGASCADCETTGSCFRNWFWTTSLNPPFSWASTCNRVGLIQMTNAHVSPPNTSSIVPSENENKVFGNMLYYLSTRKK